KRRRLLTQRLYSEFHIVALMGRKPRNSFLAALRDPHRVHIIAEVKCASPSRGMMMSRERVPEMLSVYEEGKASAISVVTEEDHFGGSVALLEEVVATTSLPVLRKDFVIEETQIYESAEKGAAALLLIARILSEKRLRHFIGLCELLGMVPLVEVHDEEDLQKALRAQATVIGINNRDLATLEVSLETTLRLLPLVPSHVVVVSESGIRRREEIMMLRKCGVRAFLIGETLLTSSEPLEKLRELKGEEELARC
ncbi:MAG: indole-3-glycerol phosphate synthase TrpC, partial [Candidatus Caldatribacteriaceae bacterium]